MGGQTDCSRSERWWVNILPTISQLLFNKSQSGRTESHAIPWNCCKWANDWVPGRHTCSDLLFFGLIISFFVVSFYIHPFRIYNHHLIRLEDSFTPVINFSNNHQCTRCCNVLWVTLLGDILSSFSLFLVSFSLSLLHPTLQSHSLSLCVSLYLSELYWCAGLVIRSISVSIRALLVRWSGNSEQMKGWQTFIYLALRIHLCHWTLTALHCL